MILVGAKRIAGSIKNDGARLCKLAVELVCFGVVGFDAHRLATSEQGRQVCCPSKGDMMGSGTPCTRLSYGRLQAGVLGGVQWPVSSSSACGKEWERCFSERFTKGCGQGSSVWVGLLHDVFGAGRRSGLAEVRQLPVGFPVGPRPIIDRGRVIRFTLGSSCCKHTSPRHPLRWRTKREIPFLDYA